MTVDPGRLISGRGRSETCWTTGKETSRDPSAIPSSHLDVGLIYRYAGRLLHDRRAYPLLFLARLMAVPVNRLGRRCLICYISKKPTAYLVDRGHIGRADCYRGGLYKSISDVVVFSGADGHIGSQHWVEYFLQFIYAFDASDFQQVDIWTDT